MSFQNCNSFLLKSQGTKIKGAFPQGTYNFQNLGNEALAIADHKDVSISKFA